MTNVCSDSIIINVRRKKEVSTDPLDRIYMVSNSQVLFTYKEDVGAVRESFRKMLEDGVYKAELFENL